MTETQVCGPGDVVTNQHGDAQATEHETQARCDALNVLLLYLSGNVLSSNHPILSFLQVVLARAQRASCTTNFATITRRV